MRLNNKIILVTGSSSDIATACVDMLASEGATVVASTRTQERADQIASQFGRSTVVGTKLDVRNEDQWRRVTSDIEAEHGRLDGLVSVASVSGMESGFARHDPEALSFERWTEILRSNLDGVFLGCKYCLPLLRRSQSSSIVLFGSRSGRVGFPQLLPYAAAKAAIENVSKSMAVWCAQQGYPVRCNTIIPANIDSSAWDFKFGKPSRQRAHNLQEYADTLPFKRLGTPQDIANAVVYLVSDESRYVTGTALVVDGGVLAGGANTYAMPE